MTILITKRKTQSPPKYHQSAQCSMVRNYRDGYREIKTLGDLPVDRRGWAPCMRSGPCRRIALGEEAA